MHFNGEYAKCLQVMSYGKALRIAEKQGVDLLEVAPTARPPVCKLGNREQVRPCCA